MDGKVTLLDGSKKEIVSCKSKISMISEFSLGNYDVEITESITAEDLQVHSLQEITDNDDLLKEKDHNIKLNSFVSHRKPLSKRHVPVVRDIKALHDPSAGMIFILILSR